MKTNLGNADRVIRLLAAVVIGALLMTGALSGTAAWLLGTLAVVFLLTSIVKFCPVYWGLKRTSAKKAESLSH